MFPSLIISSIIPQNQDISHCIQIILHNARIYNLIKQLASMEVLGIEDWRQITGVNIHGRTNKKSGFDIRIMNVCFCI